MKQGGRWARSVMNQRVRNISIFAVFFTLVLLAACGSVPAQKPSAATPDALPSTETSAEPSAVQVPAQEPEPEPDPEPEATPTAEPEIPVLVSGIRTDYEAFLPNEMGRIPVVMFHRFIEAFDENTDKDYTTTFEVFEALLHTLYEADFRLVSMEAFLSGRIAVPAGFRPMVFSFDDGTSGQFSLVEEGGQLVVNPSSAVGIMMSFSQSYPDFGLEGTFNLNMDMGEATFRGAGTLKERLDILTGLGLDLGTHTWGHVDFTRNGSRADVEQALGRNQKALTALHSDWVFNTLALPYGSRPKDVENRKWLISGVWEDTPYQNDGIFAVGAGPTVPPYDKRFDPTYIARVRATGRVAVEADLNWWLAEAGGKTWFVSDGDPQTLVIPDGVQERLDPDRTGGFDVVIYDAMP